MKKTSHNQSMKQQQDISKNISLEELDVIMRKCNHLHDEEIVLNFSRMTSRLKGLFFAPKSKHSNH